MRELLVRRDSVECIIGLGPNLFYNSPMEACIMICRMTKQPERRERVLFINAINEVERKNAQSFLEDRHIRRIATAYETYCDEAGFAKVVTLDDIAVNNFSLNISLYVKPEDETTAKDTRTVQECYANWLASATRMHQCYQQVNAMLKKVDVDNA